MTSTPAYGFRISGRPQTGPMSQAVQAGDIKGVQDILRRRFPGLQFETIDTELEEVEKPQETASVTTSAFDVERKVPEKETTATLYGYYMDSLPDGVRDLVTTDYKGVRGGRLGAGNYTTASIIPGAQVSTPTPAPAPAPTGGGTTYNAPVVGGNWEQYYGDYYAGDVNYGTIGYGTGAAETAPSETTATPAETARGLTPAWAKTSAQQPKTASKAAAGLVPSTTQTGTYVAPTSPEASRAAAGAAQRIESAVSAGQGLGARSAAGSDGRMGAQAAAALIAAPGSDKKAAERALKQAEKGNIELTNQAKKALEKAAKKK